MYLNGRRISQDELNCDWTNFKKCVYYDVYDVSQFLKIGTNILEVELGNGMYNPAPLKLFGKYNLRNNLAEVGQPRFILDLVNDDKVILTSDSSWILGNGKRLFNNLYLGETVDNNLEANYYAQVQIDDCKRNLVLSEIPKIKRCGDILPQSFINQSDGIIVDFGKMISGFINFACTAHKNQEIVLQYSEAMVDNHLVYSTCLAGSVGERIGEHVIAGGTGAPAIAIQTDRLICKEGYNQFTNKFTYHSFRFVRITGIELTQLQQIYATYVHTDLKKIAKITVDNQELQQLYDAATRTKLNNVHGTFEDCARERLGYGGDMVALATSNLYTFELDKLYKKIIKDFRFEQTAMGGIPETAPYMGIQSNGTAKGEGPILWQLVYPYLVYKHYQYYTHFGALQSNFSKDRLENSWDPVTNPDGIYPLWAGTSNEGTEAANESNSTYIEDGSYLRMQTLTLGYTLPKSILNKIKFEKIRVYGQVSNVFTLTGYSGLDPEVRSNNEDSSNDMMKGIDYGSYGMPRQFI